MGCLNSKMASSVELDPKVTPDGVQLAALTEETLTQHDAQVYDPSTAPRDPRRSPPKD